MVPSDDSILADHRSHQRLKLWSFGWARENSGWGYDWIIDGSTIS
jgi:hypothetical protein